MTLCQPSATQLQLNHLYPQKGLLYPRKISRDSQYHCTSCPCAHRFHHQTLVVVALTEHRDTLISLPPFPGMKWETLLNHMVGIIKVFRGDFQGTLTLVRALRAQAKKIENINLGFFPRYLPNYCAVQCSVGFKTSFFCSLIGSSAT